MKKIKNLVIGGIENKVFNLVIISILVICIVFMAVAQISTNNLRSIVSDSGIKQREAITGITSQVMEDATGASLSRSTELEAYIVDQVFKDLAQRVGLLRDYAQILLADPASSEAAPYAAPDPTRNGELTAQLMLADSLGGSVSPELAVKLGAVANMSEFMSTLFKASDDTNSCFVALPEGTFLVVDDRSATKYDENGDIVSYDPRTRPWYKQAVEAGGLIFTDVEVDAFTGDIGIVCACPVYVDGRLAAVVGSDLFLNTMQEAINASEENGLFLFVVNSSGHVVFSPKQDGTFKVILGSEAKDLRNSDNRDFSVLLRDSQKGSTGLRLLSVDGHEYYMFGSPIGTLGWTLVSAFSKEMADTPAAMMEESYGQIQNEATTAYRNGLEATRKTTLLVIIAAFALITASALILGKRIVKPLNQMTDDIKGLSETNLEFRMKKEYETGDEIEVLAESFANISHKTVMYLDQVKNVTAEKERVATELTMANQIQESMLPSIFPAFPDRPEFDIFARMDPAKEVGGDFYDFFLVDEDHLCMVIADVSGKGVPAALFMMASKIIIQSVAMMGNSPAEILKRTNDAICSNNKMDMFVTVWLGILEISTGKLVASNAGHEYPYIARNGKFTLYKDKHSFVIGGMDGEEYSEYSLQLDPGDMLFTYTDGVVEANTDRKELFGNDRLTDVLNARTDPSCEELVEDVKDAVDAFVDNAPQFDDCTMLAFRYNGPQAT